MKGTTSPDAATKARTIQHFNKAVQSSAHFEARRKIKTSATVFFDSRETSVLCFRESSPAWCTMTQDLADWLAKPPGSNRLIRFLNSVGAMHSRRHSEQESTKEEASDYLKQAMILYLQQHFELANSYEPKQKLAVSVEILLLDLELRDRFHDLKTKPSIVEYIKHRLFRQQEASAPQPASEVFLFPRKRGEPEVLRLRDEKKYSIKDICTLSKISRSKYYEICKRKKYSDEHHEGIKPQPRLRGGLSSAHIAYIKRLADDPTRSCTVPDMCQEMKRQFELDVSRKTVHYHLTKTLGYSYQRNHFKSFTAFKPPQKLVNYKVCKALIDFHREHKNIICLDESWFHLGVQKEYSYAKRCQHPFRIGRQSVSKLSIIMAITNRQVFAYQMRKGTHSEHSFIAFILDLTRKIHQLGADYESNVVLFLDNAPFHTSSLALKVLTMLPFPVFFNAPSNSDLNPIESIFGIIKARLKKRNPTDR